MREFLGPMIKFLRGRNIAILGAEIFFIIALLWVIFGFFKLLFILLMTGVGYTLGVIFFRDMDSLRKWLDKLLPPGMFR